MTLSLLEIATRADALYDKREEIENVRASLRLMEDAATPDAFEIAWRRGRAHFFLGQEAQSKREARAHYTHGFALCDRTARREPMRVEGHFWSGVNHALLASLINPLSALNHALRARRALNRAIIIDPAYHAAGPLRVLARLEHKLPHALGGGTSRARANFERAIELAPGNTVTRIYFAEMLLETGDVQHAHTQLEAILNTKPDPAWAFEITRDQHIARDTIKSMGEKGKGGKGKAEREG